MSRFYTTLKRQKIVDSLTFFGSIEMWHWTKMGWEPLQKIDYILKSLLKIFDQVIYSMIYIHNF